MKNAQVFKNFCVSGLNPYECFLDTVVVVNDGFIP